MESIFSDFFGLEKHDLDSYDNGEPRVANIIFNTLNSGTTWVSECFRLFLTTASVIIIILKIGIACAVIKNFIVGSVQNIGDTVTYPITKRSSDQESHMEQILRLLHEMEENLRHLGAKKTWLEQLDAKEEEKGHFTEKENKLLVENGKKSLVAVSQLRHPSANKISHFTGKGNRKDHSQFVNVDASEGHFIEREEYRHSVAVDSPSNNQQDLGTLNTSRHFATSSEGHLITDKEKNLASDEDLASRVDVLNCNLWMICQTVKRGKERTLLARKDRRAHNVLRVLDDARRITGELPTSSDDNQALHLLRLYLQSGLLGASSEECEASFANQC